jgi:hypothetical protein
MRSRTFKLVLLVALAALATALTLTAASGAKSDKRGNKSSNTLKANLKGTNEVPAADPDGTGKAEVELLSRFGAVCFRLSWKNIGDPVAAHIHRGAQGENGPIVVAFSEPAFRDRGCVDGVSTDLIREIKRHPRQFYVNIHNAEFPNGAIRGQLKRSGHRRGRGGNNH